MDEQPFLIIQRRGVGNDFGERGKDRLWAPSSFRAVLNKIVAVLGRDWESHFW
jgi:hypothetical protein